MKCLRCCFNLVLDTPSKEVPFKKNLIQPLLQPIPYYRLISKFEIKIHFLLATISIQFSLFRCRQPFLGSLLQPSREDRNIYIYGVLSVKLISLSPKFNTKGTQVQV